VSTATYRFSALGTTARVTVVERAGLRSARALLHDELETIDRTCSRFLATSELNAVNAGAGAIRCQLPALRRRTTSWKRVRLDRERHTIGIPRSVELDLGATGKAFAADRAARRTADEVSSGVLVSLGGDIAVAGDPAPGGLADPGHR
jgi:FAD:protein FMN transferase